MSYNSLYVPLGIGTWSCELVPAGEFFRLSGGYFDHFTGYEERRKQERQIEDDRETFDRYFAPDYDFRQTIATDIDAIRSFMRHHLNVANWNLPTSNAAIARTLNRAVRDGCLVPVVDRERRTTARTMRAPHAPQYWPGTGGGGSMFKPHILTDGC
jgi:hypothetical protein